MTIHDDDLPRHPLAPHFDLSITPTFVMMVVGLVVYLVTGNGRSEQTQQDLAKFQVSVAGQFGDLRRDLTAQIDGVRKDIASLPDQRAQLEVVRRQIEEISRRNAEQDARIGAVERTAITVRSDLDGIIRGSASGPARR